jgi:hypothetical protein
MMNKRKVLSFTLALALGLLVTGIVLAQTGDGYDLTWWSVDGGGGSASGGGYSLAGTVGQADAALPLTGGDYTLHSGFWAGGAVVSETCDIPLTGVSLAGPGSGNTGETLTFDASPQPPTASTPVDYTWSTDGLVSGQGTSQATYRWDSAGSKSVQVTVSNCGEQDFNDSQTVDISAACTQPITGVAIVGLDTGYTNEDYDFTANPQPADASAPVTYTWSADGLANGQDTTEATYNWSTTGTHALTVTAENCGGLVSDVHTITLSSQTVCTDAITSVTIKGPATGDKGTDIIFTATVAPSNATLPINYAWSSANLLGGQGTANATYRWTQSGAYTITVSAGNCGGSKNASHQIEIGQQYIYLPLVTRNR